MSKKVPIKQILRENDAFLTYSERVYNFYLTHKRKVLSIALAIVAVLLLIIVFVNVRSSNREKAISSYYSAFDNTDPSKTLANMEQVRKDWKGYPADRLAAFAMVDSYVRLNRFTEAKELLSTLTQSLTKGEENLNILIYSYLGSISEESEDLKTALENYIRAKSLLDTLTKTSKTGTIQGTDILEDASGPFLANLLNSIARVNLALGRTDEAKSHYAELMEKFPDTVPAQVAGFQLNELDNINDQAIETLTETAGSKDSSATAESPKAVDTDETGKDTAGEDETVTEEDITQESEDTKAAEN
jgi:tetratricopeptide (TPR) repeat protein